MGPLFDSSQPPSTLALPSLRRLLMILAAACVIPAVGLALGAIGYHYFQERNAMEARAIASSRAAMTAVEERLHDIELALTGLAASPQLTTRTLAQFEQQAAAVQRSEEAANITLVDTAGRQLMSTLAPSRTRSSQPARPVPRSVQRGRPAVEDLFDSALAHAPMVSVSIPVFAGEQVRYGLIADVDPAVLQEVLLRQQLPPGWIASVIDGSGKILARTKEHSRHVGTKADADLVQRISQLKEDALERVAVDGMPLALAISRSANSGWSTVIGIPQQELVAPARNSLALLLGGAALVLALTLWLSYSMARRISGSIVELGAAVRRAGHVPSIELPPPQFQEAHQLGQAFLSATAELQDAYEKVGRNEQRLRAVLDTATDAIVAADATGKIVLFNRAAELMFRADADQVIGESLDMFVPPAARAAHRQAMQSFTENRQPARMTRDGRVVQAQRADGTLFPAEASISVAIEDGRRLYTAILRDVSEREQHKQALVRSNLELQELALVASQDLRSPLKSITGYLDLLETHHADALANVGLALVARARKAAIHMARLTQNLLAYARLQDRAQPVMVPVDSQAIVADAMQLLHEDIRDTRAQVQVGRLPTVSGDSGQLVQLFFNLLGNALKYRRGTPRIEVTAQRHEGRWLFAVRDNGIGIEPQYLDRIFDTFKRVHTQREYPGTGIGLALCRRVAESHGGAIWATSKPGQGSTFFFTLAAADVSDRRR